MYTFVDAIQAESSVWEPLVFDYTSEGAKNAKN